MGGRHQTSDCEQSRHSVVKGPAGMRWVRGSKVVTALGKLGNQGLWWQADPERGTAHGPSTGRGATGICDVGGVGYGRLPVAVYGEASRPRTRGRPATGTVFRVGGLGDVEVVAGAVVPPVDRDAAARHYARSLQHRNKICVRAE